MNAVKTNNSSIVKALLKVLQGTLIGLGAVLPGISGGVLCVIFGIYKPVMELLSHPFKNFKSHVPKLIPVIIGVGIGFIGIAKLLDFFLTKYEADSSQQMPQPLQHQSGCRQITAVDALNLCHGGGGILLGSASCSGVCSAMGR